MKRFSLHRLNLARRVTLGVALIGLVAVAAFQFRTEALTPVEASPMKVATQAATVPPVIKVAEEARPGLRPIAPQSPIMPRPISDDLEPRIPHTPVRPTPTGVVFPDPIFPPKFDGVARSAAVPILMYHYISTPPSANDKIRVGLSVTPEMFDAQMKLLADNGFTTITLFDLYNTVATGQSLPARPIVLTFDDGYVDNYEQAFPILKKYGQTGTFFVLTGPPDAKDPAYMSWDMIIAMSKAGMDMQLHSKDHVDLRNRGYDYLIWEIIGGRQSIEGHTGKPVVFMAYPSGKYDAAVLKFLAANNFWAALTTESGRTHTVTDALTWTRVRIAGQLRLADFARLLGISAL
jgi:peptidoglycan/xylan/chitin deacetylase (PgdA/CDA1 family)